MGLPIIFRTKYSNNARIPFSEGRNCSRFVTSGKYNDLTTSKYVESVAVEYTGNELKKLT